MRSTQTVVLAALAVLAVGCPNPDKLRTPNTGGTNLPGTGGTAGGGGAGKPGDASDGTSATGGAGTGGTGGATAGTGGAGGTAGSTGGAAGGSGGAVGTGGTGGMVLTHSQVCEQYAESLAQIFVRCSPSGVEAAFGTTATHRARLRVQCNLVDLPGVKWPPQPFAPCATALANLSCADFLDGAVPPVCQLGGDFANGAACGAGDQCQSRYCGEVAANGCGKCAPRPQQGAACQGGCDDGLLCNGQGVCVRPGNQGDVCSVDNAPCRGSLVCLAGLCQPRQAAGAACATVDECNFHAGVLCDTDQAVCVNVAYGNMCGVRQDGTPVGCAGSGTCNAGGTCTPPAADGAACDDNGGPRCLWPATCNGTCQLPSFNRSCNAAAPAPRRPPGTRRGFGSLGFPPLSPLPLSR